MADNLTTFLCRLSRNLGASTSWIPQGLSRPVMGLLYLVIKLGVILDIKSTALERLDVSFFRDRGEMEIPQCWVRC
jgi:hypothetical protein